MITLSASITGSCVVKLLSHYPEYSQLLWHIIPAHTGLKQEDGHGFEISLGYSVIQAVFHLQRCPMDA